MKNKKMTGSVLVAVISLVTLVIGATYAYFTVATTNSFGTKTATATAESIGTVAITAGSDLSLTVTRAQMSKTNVGNIYYATGDNISSGTLGTVKVTGEGMYSCDYTMSITLSGTMLSSIQDDRNTILYVNDIPYDIYTYKDAGTITLNGTINGLVQATPQRIKGNIAVFNTEKDQSGELAGKTISASIKVTNITCTVGDDLLASKIVQLSGQTVGDGTVININEDEYRYSGSDPDNYITFNDETWRIIGIVDGYVKIIRNDSLGYFSWDYKTSGVGASKSNYGSVYWTESQLMMMLNPVEYLKEGYTINNNMVYDPNGKLVYSNMGSYYNRTSGYRPAQMSLGATSYNANALTFADTGISSSSIDFSSTGLNATAKNLIQENVWYLTPIDGMFAESYRTERHGIYYRWGDLPITWLGKVGLMYVSDYYYADKDFYNGRESEPNCDSNWLCVLDAELPDWTLGNSGYNGGTEDYVAYVFQYHNPEIDTFGTARDALNVRPVVYLKSGIKVTGTGTIDSKYQIIS